MATSMRKGQKVDLTKNNPALKKILINFGWQTSKDIELDTAAFLLTAGGKVSGDDNFIFYNNPKGPNDCVMHLDDGRIKIDLPNIPSEIQKIAITLTIYGNQNFGQVKNANIRLTNFDTEDELLQFSFGEQLTVETAIVVGEIYRHKGEWKFNAVGAGFSGGLEALCNNFGIEVKDITGADDNSFKAKSKEYRPTQSTTPPKKVELKKGQKISLVKSGAAFGEIVINLNWSQPQRQAESGGFLSRIFGGSSKNNGIDLDLGCLYELKDGNKGVIQALGNCFGTLNNPPYIALDGDDRTGSNAAGETIRVNGKHFDKIKRILVFTFIYEGIADWREADGVVTVKCPGNPDIIVKMDEYGSNLPNCGIALIENQGNTFSVEKIVRFYQSTRYLDQDFNWGLRWTIGRK